MKIRVRKRIWIVGWTLVGWLFLHLLYISWDGLHDDAGKADIAIILGNPVQADGTLSPWLKGRVDRAIALYQQGRVKKIFASGAW